MRFSPSLFRARSPRSRSAGGPAGPVRQALVVDDADRRDAQVIWDHHLMGHVVRPCEVAIGFGSHDLGVATRTAELYRAGLCPLVVFTGANSPTTRGRFPRGEAEHYRERAVELGVPPAAILVEPRATNTGANLRLSRELLAGHGMRPASALLVCKPYMERRVFATAARIWPELDVVCTSESLSLPEYVASIGDERLVIDMIVGDLQRVVEYPGHGFAVEQHVPTDVRGAYERLTGRGFTSRTVS